LMAHRSPISVKSDQCPTVYSPPRQWVDLLPDHPLSLARPSTNWWDV
jgi:hypothetical protein